MTGILSREEEFHKINQHLNNMTKHAIDTPQPAKIDPKFSTYTKKGPITVHRRNDDKSVIGLKDKNSNNVLKDIGISNGARKKVLEKDPPLPEIVEEKKHMPERGAPVSPRQLSKTLPAPRHSVSKNAPNVILRYKNDSFVQSPSLEVLVKEENESVRGMTTSRSSEVSGGNSTVRTKVNLSSEGLVKYLKSRIAILQTEHETLTEQMTNQKELVDKSFDRQKKIESQRDMAYSRNNILAEQMTKLETQLEDALRRMKESEVSHNETRKELELLRRETKVLTQTNANLEKRLYRTNEELENTRNTLSQLKNAEKEIKESVRSDADVREKQIKGLKKQRADLLNAYKKQLFLIDNLKRQNLCMEQSRMISIGEKEFTKVLDWHSKN